MPTTNSTPAELRLFGRPLIALVKICWAVPGASLSRLSISVLVAEWPTSPTIEISAITAGKMARIP